MKETGERIEKGVRDKLGGESEAPGVESARSIGANKSRK